MPNCFDVANYYLKRQDPDAGDLISNLKLQKLVYYAQGFHLAITGTPLFDEPIEAWEHGPVCTPLFQHYKHYEGNAIPVPYEIDTGIMFNEQQLELLEMIQDYYGQFSAWKLRNLTHEDAPWINAYNKARNTVITHQALKKYFKTQLTDED